ncbi:MBL fold metallo-hydrolase [Candidatus Bathyarchaeota archaeon]|nr:MBL fold metallo-hydrolase [Candidatus Bathyarchaeota archaeon]
MQIQTYNVGMLSTNCYVINCTETREAIIIDPGFEGPQEAEVITIYVDENSLKVKFIINTHGHSDHISGDLVLKRKYDVPICIHTFDAPCLYGLGETFPPANVPIEDGQLLRFGHGVLRVIHTPGHSVGSISLVGNKLVFTGDTLFAGGMGRTDFAGGSDCDMKRSLQKLMTLPDDYIMYPGHGNVSIMGEEKRSNPFLRWL